VSGMPLGNLLALLLTLMHTGFLGAVLTFAGGPRSMTRLAACPINNWPA